jgi:hypothetical protein
MPPLSARQVLDVWDRGQRQHPLERALTILETAFPETPLEELARLDLGQRDAKLLEVLESTFGDTLRGFAACPGCSQPLEFELPAARLHAPSNAERPETFSLSVADIDLRFRLPNSLDLAAVAGVPDETESLRQLLRRCVVEAVDRGDKLDPSTLPPAAIDALSDAMEKADPRLECFLEVHCPQCQQPRSVVLEIAVYLWQEIAACAQDLLAEVHALARAYAWRERDILELSSQRRRRYLELVGA